MLKKKADFVLLPTYMKAVFFQYDDDTKLRRAGRINLVCYFCGKGIDFDSTHPVLYREHINAS